MIRKKNSTARQTLAASTTKKRAKSAANFPIVGIGASAGGLEAITELLANLPADIKMALVIVQHLDPSHESLLVDILSRKIRLPIKQIKNNMRVQDSHVYVIPPNASLNISKGIFKVVPRLEGSAMHLPIDCFLKSLAEDQQDKCIGIILSGTASDGTSGLTAVKAVGGLTIAQDPPSAKYDGMPRSAIAAGVVDMVLSPNMIGEELVRIAENPIIISEKLSPTLHAHDESDSSVENYFDKILTLLNDKCHVDFHHYKRNTLNRRILRRMVLQKKKHLKEYFEYLESHLGEIECLFADILINVTEFFRDPNVFEQLKLNILPTIIKNKPAHAPLRIWVVGCATGEEAYSVAMSLLEIMGDSNVKQSIQVFATDISEASIKTARAAVYPLSISNYISAERIARFFTKTESGYRIKNFVREICLFSWHDVTSDPPYAKLDLICCRNLMIYFDQALQEHILPIFHYALKPQGFLWLGSAENIGKSLAPLFNLTDKKNKFYARKSTPSMQKFHFPTSSYIPEKLKMVKEFSEKSDYHATDIARETDRISALKYAPPGVVVNDAMEIILIRGEVAPYLQLVHGQASFNIFKMTRAELAADLRMAMRVTKKKNTPTRKNGCTLRLDKQLITFNLDVIPFHFTQTSQIHERYFLISFETVRSGHVVKSSATPASIKGKQRIDSQDKYIVELEQEKSDNKSYQKTLIQDFEITQEELTSTNEELQSTVEELQSTNEELETAKEELQSSNEELTTVNDEMQSRNIELAKLNDDLVNLLECVDIPIVMVGMDRCIRRFTPKARKMLRLIQTDVGRPISDIKPNFEMLDLGALVSDVIETMAIKEMNIEDKEGRWFRLQVRPYMTMENKIDGAVIALVDINLLKQNLLESESSLDYATSIANTLHLPLVVLDKKLRLKSANHAFYEHFQTTAAAEGTDLFTLIGTNEKIVAEIRKTLTVAFVANIELKDLEVEYTNASQEQGTMLLNGRRIKWVGDEEPNALLLCIQDITDRLKLETSLKDAIIESKKANQSKDLFLATLSHELRTPLTAILCWAQLLLKMEEGSAKLRHGLQSIEQNSIIQGKLIDDLLDVSRIQSGKLVLSISQLDPSDVVRTAVESVRPLADKKSVLIKTHIKPLKGDVAADPARLQQIVWNLLINAIKFSPANNIIDIHVKPVREEGRPFVAIDVIDHGKGIKPDFLPQLFNRFTQADNTTTRMHGGLGLGLTIARDLLKLLGGKIHAASAGEGKGATFTVLLPLIPNKAMLNMKAKCENIAAGESASLWRNLNGLRILIVEDEQNSLIAITELLNFAGAKTISVTSSHEAMIALAKDRPDILISDIAMPGKDGFSLMEDIRARGAEQGGQIPAIALTAYTSKEDLNRALLAGFDAHLAKPFNAIDLIACIANLAARRGESNA